MFPMLIFFSQIAFDVLSIGCVTLVVLNTLLLCSGGASKLYCQVFPYVSSVFFFDFLKFVSISFRFSHCLGFRCGIVGI